MMTLNELFEYFCKDQTLGNVARALRYSTGAATADELSVSSVTFSTKMAAKAIEKLDALSLLQKSLHSSNNYSYTIRPETRSIVERAVLAMEDDFIARRAAQWNIDAKGRLEWIEGMYKMIQKGRESYHANLR